jgi:hypothetical protein
MEGLGHDVFNLTFYYEREVSTQQALYPHTEQLTSVPATHLFTTLLVATLRSVQR